MIVVMSAQHHRVAIALLASAAVLALAGCAPDAPEPVPSQSSSTPPSPGAGDDNGQEPDPGPTVGPVGTPVDIPCDQLVAPEVMYAYNPNFALLAEPAIPESTAISAIAEERGLVCQWQNLSSDELITVAVADLPDEALTVVKNDTFAESTMVPTYGVEGYFRVADGAGEAVAFDGSYWLVATSTYFLEPGDPAEIMEAALTALP